MATKKTKNATTGTTPAKPKGAPRIKKNIIAANNSKITIYASPKISKAMEIILDMKIFEGVKVLGVIEAAYHQGKKDGARDAFDHINTGITAAQKAVPHKNPGQPKKKK